MNEYFTSLNEKEYQISLISENKVILNNEELSCEVLKEKAAHFVLKVEDSFFDVIKVSEKNGLLTVFIGGQYFVLETQTKLQRTASQIIAKSAKVSKGATVKSPMPGLVLKIKKSVGDTVKEGEAVLILEAMKMENEIKSPRNGTIIEIPVSEKNPVDKGSVLFKVQ